MPTQFPPKGDADKRVGAYEAPISVSQQDVPSMTVKIRAGSFFNGANEFVEYPGGTTPLFVAPVGNPVWALVSLTNAGTVQIVYGTPASVPSLPALVEGTLPLAAVYLTPSTTAITQQQIIDVRPFLRTVDVVPNLPTQLANRPTTTDVSNMLADKADIDGTPSTEFQLNSDANVGFSSTNAALTVRRGELPTVAIRWNEGTDLWELTNDGVTYSPIASAAGTYAPLMHTHVAADITNFNSAVNALVALATISQSQVSGLVPALNAKADDADLTSHVSDGSIHFTLPIAQSDVVGLTTALASKANAAGGTFTGNVTVQQSGHQPITLASFDSGSSGLIVDRTAVTGPAAILEWDESSGVWLIGTVGSVSNVVTGTALDTKADKVTQVIAGAGLSGGGSLDQNVTIGMPTVHTPVSNAFVKVTTDPQGRITGTTPVVAGDLPAHTHVPADVVGFVAAAAAAAPVQTVAGRTGSVVITSADLADFSTAASTAAPVQTVAGRTGAVVLTTSDLADFATAVTAISNPAYVNVGGDVMTGNLSLGGNRVTGLAAAGAPGEAVRYDEFVTHTHVPGDIIGFAAAAAAAAPVTSVNGETGVVSLNAADVGAAATVHTHVPADIIGFATAAAAAAPVQSVNGETGVVSLNAADVGAASAIHTHVAADITNFNTAADARIAAAVGVTVQPFNAGTLTTANIGASVQAFDPALQNLSSIGANGFIARTGTDSFTPRSIAGTSGRVTVTNGDGAAGDPTINVVESGLNHELLSNIPANTHVDHTAVILTAGVGLNGGGNIAASRTFDVAATKGTGAITFPAISVHDSADGNETISVPGAQVGDTVTLGLVSPPAPFVYQAFVSAPGVVTIRCTSPVAANAGDANVTVNVIVFNYAQF